MADRHRVELLVLPGQKRRRVREWSKVAEDVSAGRYAGVVYFSTFGYHTPAEESLKSLTRETKRTSALDQYLVRTREEELDVFRPIAEAIRRCSKRTWLLSVVAKQDLWAEEEAEVLSHYLRGEYVKLVDELATEKPVDTFAHEFAFCSLVIANLRDPSGEVVKKTVAGYDSQRQIRSVRHLVELLDGLRKWETRK